MLPLFTLRVPVVFDMVGALLVTSSIVSVEVDPKLDYREIELTQKNGRSTHLPLSPDTTLVDLDKVAKGLM